MVPRCVAADGIDTEHIFGFMIGADVGEAGELEFQSQTTGRFTKSAGRYRAVEQELELETVPVDNFRVELGSSFAAHDIVGVPDIDDRRQLGWQGMSVDFRYKFLDRHTAPFGFTLSVDPHAARMDEITGAPARNYGADVTAVFERELVPNVAVAALNLVYQPEWTRFAATGAAVQEATIGAAFGTMVQVHPNILLGGEARYFRNYDGIGLQDFAGQALFVGPVAYFQLSERSRLTATWSVQAWGRPAASAASVDLVNFERHQARLVFGISF
ncbi:MAG TPA: hypothetical protein VKY22_20300 [Bradyrhizobium sp.]|nr:hypothetical protein [Bradyrhizobium sp.]